MSSQIKIYNCYINYLLKKILVDINKQNINYLLKNCSLTTKLNILRYIIM